MPPIKISITFSRIFLLLVKWHLKWVVALVLVSSINAEGQIRRGPPSRIIGYHVEDFFRPISTSRPRLSPDGTKVAYATVRRGRTVLVIKEIETGIEFDIIAGSTENDVFTTIEWKGNQRLIFQFNYGDIRAIDYNGLNNVLLHSSVRMFISGYAWALGGFAYPRVLHTLPRDTDHLLIQVTRIDGETKVIKVNIHDGKETIMEQPRRGVQDYIADADGVVRIGSGMHKRQMRFVYRATQKARWQPLDKVVKDTSGIDFDFTGKTYAGRQRHVIGFGADRNRFYFTSNSEQDHTALFTCDLTTGVTSLVAADDDYDLHTLIQNDSGPIKDKQTGEILGFFYQRDKPVTVWFDKKFEAIQQQIDRLLPGSINLVVDMDWAHKVLIVVSFSSLSKGTYHTFFTESQQMQLVAESDRSLAPEDMSPMHPVELRGRSGHRLNGYITIPLKHEQPAPNNLILLIHGGPWVRDTYVFNPEVQFLAYHGYTVLQINYRGSSGYGFSHRDALRNDLERPVLEDLQDAVQWAIDAGYTERGRVAAMGASFGAFAALSLLNNSTELFAAGVVMSGLYDLPVQMKYQRSKATNLGYEFWTEMAGGPWNSAEIQRMSPIRSVNGLSTPVLIVHGEDDVITPIEQAHILQSRLKELNKPHEVLLLKEEGHGVGPLRNRILIYERTLEFLNKELPPSK